MTKKEAIKAIDKAVELQHKEYNRYRYCMGNCIVLMFFSYEISSLFTKLFKPKNRVYISHWMATPLNRKCKLTDKQIYEDRITALLFLKEYVKQHGVNV